MATKSVIFFASALCFLSIFGVAVGESRFFVEGTVYCDTCRAQFVTRISEYIKGALVRLECRNREGGDLTFTVEAHTDDNGLYRLPVDGDHEEDVCEIVLVKSNMPGCTEVSKDPFLKKSARISLTSNNGMASPIRNANPLGFMKDVPLKECADVFKELGMKPEGLVD